VQRFKLSFFRNWVDLSGQIAELWMTRSRISGVFGQRALVSVAHNCVCAATILFASRLLAHFAAGDDLPAAK
jgi:hypothetical protein